jgi:predicted RNA-binding Zn-ribbon protein involved in translation (DUF1610 family)
MEHFRHNLSPVEVKVFLKTIADLRDNLLIIYVNKISADCPQCGHQELCRSGAVSLFSSSFDKITHEMSICLNCGDKKISTCLTCEKL